jgi:hypothetical protein
VPAKKPLCCRRAKPFRTFDANSQERGVVQLVHKQNALSTEREELRRNPFRAVCGYPGRAGQIDGIELHRSDVEELAFAVRGSLSNNLGLADAARAPDVQGHTFPDQRMKRLVELERCDGIGILFIEGSRKMVLKRLRVGRHERIPRSDVVLRTAK